MKQLKYIIIILLGTQLCLSCTDFLDKELDTELTLPMVFEDKTRMEGWLANVYSAIPHPTWDYLRSGEGWDVMGDELTPSERWRQFGWDMIPRILGEWTPMTDWLANYWERLPKYIRSAYIFIENVKPLPDQGVSAQEVEYMKAECRFLAAYYYYLLVNTYGAIPFQPGYIAPTDATTTELMTGQTPYDDVVDWLDRELVAVSKILPAHYTEANKYGRATSIMCMAVRARMLLFAASDLVNGNPDYAGYVNNEGTPIFNSVKDPSKWTRAATACKELIDAAADAGHELYIERNADGSIDPFMSLQNLFLTEYTKGNREILFARPSEPNRDYEKHATPGGSGGNGGLGVTQRLVDAFFMRNGLPKDLPGSGYVEDGFSTANDVRNTRWNGCKSGGIITETGAYNMYCNREPRFYTAVYYHGAWYPSARRNLEFFLGQRDNSGTYDAPQNGYLARKKTSPLTTFAPTESYVYRPDILYRLGEAYLNYSEALNESDPGNVNILFYLNKIRERAGIRQYTHGATDNDFIHVDNTQDAMRKIIRAERHVELCCEGIRYDDLRRWTEAEERLTGGFDGMNARGTNNAEFYIRTVYQTRQYKKQFYWFPISQNQMDKNPNLVQMPYWTQAN
ncbi:MAG: RagB/SusD family nutrient uptake outer membrane protein [Prevotellaceae bacterium]|jgi:hypothetical protein|nr:RagB/SusD family nutrient uptake outer membrane protein [Prevotellaceae bacterium]